MKTITEFNSIVFSDTLAKLQTWTTENKTAEEIETLVGEATKLEGERIKLLLNAVEITKTKMSHLKRVVVLTAAEGEKAPDGMIAKDAHFFLIEHHSTAPRKEAPKDDSFGGKGFGKDKKRGGNGNRDNKGRDDRRPSSDNKAVGENKPSGEKIVLTTSGKPSDNTHPAKPRFDKPRGPRPERPNPPSLPGVKPIVISVKTADTAAANFSSENKPKVVIVTKKAEATPTEAATETKTE
jgi:hypothetical protein